MTILTDYFDVAKWRWWWQTIFHESFICFANVVTHIEFDIDTSLESVFTQYVNHTCFLTLISLLNIYGQKKLQARENYSKFLNIYRQLQADYNTKIADS